MSLSVETLAVARKYTDDSLAGAGAVAGVPCKIQSITAITGGNRVTFLWTDNKGDDHTSAMDVMNGVDGEDGKGIQSVTVNAQDHLIITYTDGTTVDAGQIEIHNAVDSVNGQTGAVVLDAEDVGALPDNTPIPSKTSDLTNDSGFATTSDVSTALADYTTTADLTTLLAAKQDTLTFDNVPTENSNNPVKSGGVYAANQTLTNQVKDMNNVLGAKNLLPYPYDQTTKTVNGVTFIDNGDGTITLNGTNTGTNTTFIFCARDEGKFTDKLFSNLKKMNTSFKLLGGKESPRIYYLIDFYDSSKTYISSATSRNDTPTVFTIPSNAEYMQVLIRCGVNVTYSNLTLYPMLYLASITDDTYEPYTKTNRQLTQDSVTWDDLSEVGAVNCIRNDFRTSPYTHNGVTFTRNSDDSVTISSNSQASNWAQYDYMSSSGEVSLVPGKVYKLTFEPSSITGYAPHKISLAATERLNDSVSSLGRIYADSEPNYIIFTAKENATYNVNIGVTSGNSFTNAVTFYAMIAPVDYNGPYVPPAKTNKELTDDVAIKSSEITVNTTNVDSENVTRNYVNRSAGVKVLVLQTKSKIDLLAGTTYELGTVPSDYLPTISTGFVKEAVVNSEGSTALIEVSSGKLKLTPRVNNITTAKSFVVSVTYI